MTLPPHARCLCVVTPLLLSVGFRANHGAAAEALPPDHVRVAVTTPQGDRSCVVHVPAAAAGDEPLPLVLMLHGMGGTALTAQRETGWSAKADDRRFIVAYPEATRPDAARPPGLGRNPQAWNDGSGRFHAAERKIDDVAFLDAVIDRISTDYAVDPRRLFIAGFSNGGSMAFRAAAQVRHPIAAIAAHSAACWIEPPCPARPTSICFIAGTADPLNPIDGGVPRLAFSGRDRGGPAKPPAQTFIDAWVRSLGCPEAPRIDTAAAGVRRRIYGPGAGDAEVVFITVEGLGHHWAGGVSQAAAFLVGPSTDTLVATDVTWDFFASRQAADPGPVTEKSPAAPKE